MSLTQRLTEYISACFTGLWIESHEHEDALREIAQLCREQNWRLATWDIEQGLQIPGQNKATDAGGSDPLAAIRSINALASADSSAILVLANFHRFLSSPEIVQALARQIALGKQNRTFVVILSPVVAIPVELEKLFAIVEHELPHRQQIEEIARGVATEEGELPDGTELDRVLDAAAGLTRYEAENAFSLSLIRHQRIEPQSIWELKSQMLKKSGLLQLHRGGERFANLGGLESMKSFCLRALRHQRQDPLRRARGLLLLGVPGTGKSAFAKALGNETGRPTLTLDIGALMGSLVGQTEQNVRQALKIADAMMPAILFCDELEKGLSGAASSGSSDSGVSARLFGSLLTWLNDHESDVFFIGTCNDVSKLPPEFSRAERFDAIYFLDLPSVQQKQAIWKLYLDLFGLDHQQPKPIDAQWTGAEIRACCRLAALLEVPLVEAAQNVVPVATTAAESVSRLRAWASGRCLNADAPGIYTANPDSGITVKPGRKLRREPSNN
ncbi:MAG: AAA family ATPase [Planctomycetota bacterium]